MTPSPINASWPGKQIWRVQRECFAVDRIVRYIEGQETHHRKMSFQEEFIALLKKHRIEYDERYLWE
jgi:hypothetical protein